MAQGKTIEVNFLPQRQQTPDSNSIPGQMKFIKNGQIVKFDGSNGPSIRLQKRAGFKQLSKETRRASDGTLIGMTGFPAPGTLFSSLNKEQVIVSGSNPYVLAENEEGLGFHAWSKFDYVYSPIRTRIRPTFTANTQIANPDGASIGDVFFRTWSQPNLTTGGAVVGTMAMVSAADGTPIRTPFHFGQAGQNTRARVVADSSNFWVIWAGAVDSTLNAIVYDVHGIALSTLTFATLNSNFAPFDVISQNGNILVVYGHSNGDNIVGTRLTFDGISVITKHDTTFGFNVLGNCACNWAENVSGDGFAYLMTAHFDADDPEPIVRAFKVDSIGGTMTINHFYGIGNNSGSFIYSGDGLSPGGSRGILCQMTGVNETDGFRVQLSYFDNNGTQSAYGDHHKSRMVFFNLSTASVLPTVQFNPLSFVAASRTFQIDNRNVLIVAYPSGNPSSIVNKVAYFSQPTYFMLDVNTAQICGEFNWAQAGVEWMRLGFPQSLGGFSYGPYQFMVGHVFAGLSTNVHASLAYQAQNVNEFAPGNDIIGKIQLLTSTIGFEDIEFGGLAQAVEYADELLMPGPLSTSFTGYNFGENGIALAPEQPILTAGSGFSGLTINGGYQYVIVFERTLPNGDRVQSAVSIPQSVVLSGVQNQVTVDGYSLNPTSYNDVIISIYRNVILPGGAPGTIHYKITDDLNPIFNDKGQFTFTFVDTIPDSQAAVGEPLYTDNGFVNRTPCPPFNSGCVFENRIVVAAADGSIQFSGEKSEGDAIWFSNDPAFRIFMPTNDEILALTALDGRFGILCSQSVWTETGGGFPDGAGNNGNLQAPQRLPFNNGTNGFATAYPGGALYSSDAPGTAWVLTRGLENMQIGANAVDDFAGRQIVGIDVDIDQRICFALPGNGSTTFATIEVYDQIAKVWYQYLLPTEIILSHTIAGRIAYNDHNSVWVQDTTLTRDISQVSQGSPLPPFLLSSYQTELISLGSIRDFQGLWDSIITGNYIGQHNLNVTTVQDFNGTFVKREYFFTPSPNVPYIYSFPPGVEECSRISFLFQDDFGSLTQQQSGDTFQLEALSLNVAIEPGLQKIPIAQTVAPEIVPVTGVVTGASLFTTALRLNGGQEITIIPGQTTFQFTGLPVGTSFKVSKKSGVGTLVNPTGIAGNPQIGIPTLSL